MKKAHGESSYVVREIAEEFCILKHNGFGSLYLLCVPFLAELKLKWCAYVPHYSDAYGIGWNTRMGIRQSKLSSHSSFLDKDGIFVNSTNSKLLERAHGILMLVQKCPCSSSLWKR